MWRHREFAFDCLRPSAIRAAFLTRHETGQNRHEASNLTDHRTHGRKVQGKRSQVFLVWSCRPGLLHHQCCAYRRHVVLSQSRKRHLFFSAAGFHWHRVAVARSTVTSRRVLRPRFRLVVLTAGVAVKTRLHKVQSEQRSFIG
jgi:hypothetical protein